MPLLHCNICHGEWEGTVSSRCYSCGAGGYILKEQTELEVCVEQMKEIIEGLDEHQARQGIKFERIHPLRSDILPDG